MHTRFIKVRGGRLNINSNSHNEDNIRRRETDVYIILQALSKLLKGFDFGLEISPDFNWYFIDGKSGNIFKVPLDTVSQILNEVED